MSVSFIGLGSMGSAMVSRLIDQGHEVSVWNRSRAAVDAAAEGGAKPLETAADAFANQTVVSMLANDQAVLDTFTAEVLATAASGTVHVNMATISPGAASELAERHAAAGVGYVAAPVLGRPPVAAAGQLNIVAGGPKDLVDQVQGVLDSLGKKTWYMGEAPSSANLVKIGVNFNIIHALEALGESVALVEANDVDASLFVELLTSSLFGGVAYTGYGNLIAKQEYFPAGFTVALGRKDLGLVESAAADAGLTLPTLEALRGVFDEALAMKDLEGADWAAVAEVSRRSRAK